MNTPNTLTMSKIRQRRGAEDSQATHIPDVRTNQQESDKRRSYFKDMSDLITGTFGLTDDEISMLLKITRVKLAYNVLNFAYAALVQNRGNIDKTLAALRSVSRMVYDVADTDTYSDTEALDRALRKNSLPMSATAMPSLIGIERLNIIHNAPMALTTFVTKMCAKYDREFGSLDAEQTDRAIVTVVKYFPEPEQAAAIDYLKSFEAGSYKQVTSGLAAAKEFFDVFQNGSQQELEVFVRRKCAMDLMPPLEGEHRDKVSQVTSYQLALTELINAAH